MTVEKVHRDDKNMTIMLEVSLKVVSKLSKRKKVLTWLSELHPITLNIFDDLLSLPELLPDVPLVYQVNKKSWRKCPAYVEKTVPQNLKLG